MSYQPRFEPAIMFDVKHKMNAEVGEALRWSSVVLVADVLKGVQAVDLIKFSINCLLPQLIPIEGI
jgi:hypothetical protein